ncbi:MAG TPA: phosphonate ABC transporter ATP-binding protein [Acidimicrobiales bacterium]|nr:phosphonate ABC transporter ATP-binding protein [Acidimicrobiales bacterium]
MEATASAVVTLRGVSVRFGANRALEGIDLELHRGERVALAGPSGAGKTTLLELLNGSLSPTTGTVEVLGQDLAQLRPRELRRVQSRVGTVHQQFDLVGPLRVVHNVNAGRLPAWSLAKAVWSLVSPQETAGAEAALGRVGIAEKLYERTDRLSGGQQQRVAVARALVQEPEILLADEPIASLDPGRSLEVMDLLRRLNEESGMTVVVSLHALEYARSHCQRIVGMREGRIVFDEPPPAVTGAMVAALYRIDEAEV